MVETCREVSTCIHQQSSVVLFYRYFLPSEFPLIHQHKDFYEEKLLSFQRRLCQKLNLKGRVLLASEGVNGTLSSSSSESIQTFISIMENFELTRECGKPDDATGDLLFDHFLFRNIDWKMSSSNVPVEPFPDLKISIVKEIISTGGTVATEDLRETGQHLTPSEFHQAILENPDAVLIDVRNTFEYNIGHFVNPSTEKEAENPETVTFSSFDATFCAREAERLKDKKVLMYCTGGIRCEKASVMLKKRGVRDVSQLKGGIHRYLEEYGDTGCFRGLNFVFDQRVAMKPSECKLAGAGTITRNSDEASSQSEVVVGRCVECKAPFDEICGSRICTVCRDLVLVCPTCQATLREYHCQRHSKWKYSYFTFLERFTLEELELQRRELAILREQYLPAQRHKNVRRTISRQMEKVTNRINVLETGDVSPDRTAPRRCRSCMEPNDVCDGKCWGFWKTQNVKSNDEAEMIKVGDMVEPGCNWNAVKLGPTTDQDGKVKKGVVVELKSWGSGGKEQDCVVVQWNDVKRSEPQIYRWGVLALNGTRMYDVRKT